MAREIPVYLFTGFLESGKTTFIQGTLEDERFNSGEKTLLLVCEENFCRDCLNLESMSLHSFATGD